MSASHRFVSSVLHSMLTIFRFGDFVQCDLKKV